VHEVGHFLAARWRGLVVDRFGIWFGKPLWKRKIGDVTYSLGWIPAGGFVALPQLAPMEAIEGKNETDRTELPPISAWDKIIVAFAGPLFSFLLAVVFAVVVWLIGRPVSESEITTVIGYVEKGSPAEVAGLRPGDRILEVDGHPVTRFTGMVDSVVWHVVGSEGEKIPFKVERGGETLMFEAEPVQAKRHGLRRKELRQVRIEGRMTPVVAEVEAGSPAAAAGLHPGDAILSVDGEQLLHFARLGELVRATPDREFVLGIERKDGTATEVRVTPVLMDSGEGGTKVPRIGIRWDLTGRPGLAHPRPFEQIAMSVQTIFNTLDALFSPKSGVKAEHMSGPVGIMNMYYRMFESPDGWRLAIWFSVVLNVNLALLNLLPLPVLDGGHITLALIEKIRRRPINLKVLEAVQTACVLLLVGFMLYVSFFDVQDLPFFDRAGPPAPSPAALPNPPAR